MRIILTALLVTLAMAGTAAAHPGAIVVETPASENTCYIYHNDASEPEFWQENGADTQGGAESGVIGYGHVRHQVNGAAGSEIISAGDGSGLQRGGDNKDIQYDSVDAWLTGCVLGA